MKCAQFYAKNRAALQLALVCIREGEKIRLNAWLDYLDELEAVDVFTASDIIWPVKSVV
ncbi:tail fiber assembly protein [Morganella morganii]|uniref:tail fiber assembly protein n=1 Tax=Morganella morganii TaxID=582 RepID=UPI001A30CB54|nr:tail fiber assembly protein [Morganella morganii]HAT1528373.1 tail fiber assembly protein [Morganella morganii]